MTFGGCADRLILLPSSHPIPAPGAVRRTIQHQGKTLEIWTARSPKTANQRVEAYVIEFTGNATRAEQIAVYVADRYSFRPVEAWVMNYPGYGGSDGPARLRDIPGAALAAFDELAQAAQGKPIIVAGNSLGTTAALHVAANRADAVRGMVLQNPPPLKQLILGKFGWWNLWLIAGPIAMQVPPQLDSIANAKLVNAPAVFILADHDELVSPEYQKRVVDAYAGPKTIIRLAGGHNDSVADGEARDLDRALQALLLPVGGRDKSTPR